MISPEAIRRRAERLFRPLLTAWMRGETFFPRTLHGAELSVQGMSAAEAIDAVGRLRSESKERRGWGYTVVWKEKSRGRDARQFGQNLFPHRIVFETRDDLLRLIRKEGEFQQFAAAADKVRAALPQLVPLLQRRPSAFANEVAHVDGLIEVVRYFLDHPLPRLFARELSLSTDTKFIERHEGTLRQWLDAALPPSSIQMEQRFARRFGLREAEPHRLLRILDRDLQARMHLPCDELSLPDEALAAVDPGCVTAMIVENKVNLLTLPRCRTAIALHGQGKAASSLGRVSWLHNARIVYWGDLDVDGLEILSQLRGQFPQTESLWMDEQTLDRWPQLVSRGNGRASATPPHLSPAERAAFHRCSGENLRLEQERIMQSAVRSHFAQHFAP